MAHLEEDRRGRPAEPAGRLSSGAPRRRDWSAGVPWFALVVLLLAWEGASRAGWLSPLLFPRPGVVARTTLDLLASGRLGEATATTGQRLLLGLLLGGVPGTLLGLGAGWSRRLRRVVEPIVAAVYPVPKIAILPLIMVFLGIGEAPRVFVAALAAFFPLLINSAAGVQQINPIYFDVARNYGAGRLRLFTRVVLPGSLPFMLAGLLLALNLTLVTTIAVEMLTATDGLGAMIWLGWQTMRTTELYVSLLVIALMGIGFSGLQWLWRRLTPWQVERGE